MRILICRSNPIAPDPRVEKEARALTSAGHTVAMIGWDRSGQLPANELKEGCALHRLSIPAGYARGIFNIFALLRWQWGLWWFLLRHHSSFDALHACDFDTILPALWLKTFHGKKVVYDIFDFYADHLRNTPDFIKRAIRSTDLNVINRADAVIIVDDARVAQIDGSHPRSLTVIYNAPEDQPAPILPVAAPSTGLRLAYVGLIQVERGLFDVVRLLRKHPDWTLDLAGFGGDQERIVASIADLPNIVWHGRVDYAKALELSANADALFALYDPIIPNHRYSSPNKIFEAMMLGKPIVVARDTNMDRMIEKAQAGLVVDYGDLGQLEAAFSRLADSPDLRQQLGQNARRAYEQDYSWNVMRDRLVALYAGLA